MEPNQQTSKQFFRTINILFLALFAGPFLFACIAVFMNSGENLRFQFFSSEEPVFIAATTLAIIDLFVSRIMYRYQIKRYNKDDKLHVKMATYQTAVIIRLALIEGASLLLIVSFFLSANLTALIFLGLMFIQFYFFKPSREEAIRDLHLNYNETAQVNNPDAIIGQGVPQEHTIRR
ncbi:hypothetical protein ACE01N_18205 [Saccharicrinis sp. FJH2]|uniref:hypothetical protein n=1 Tax=Saccharicrinis sp. FJH65 TaxID=3344659 RepID=UPI0035F2A535